MVKRANPQNRSIEKWYAQPVNDGRITQKSIVANIVELSSLSRGDESNVIESLIDTIPKYLLMGNSVSLGDWGTLHLSFSSVGMDAPTQFNASQISSPRVVFTPSVKFKGVLQKMHFEKE
jgi:predicted histone-like DNA-binding protein